VIFGWGNAYEKVLAQFQLEKCEACNNTINMLLVRQRVWFSVFFIPVIPYSITYYVLCPICEEGYVIKRREAKEILNKEETTCPYCNKTFLYEKNNNIIHCPNCGAEGQI